MSEQNVELPAMTGAEFQSSREYLGLTLQFLSDKFHIGDRRMRRMEADAERVPDFLVTFLDDAAEVTKETLTRLSAKYRREVKVANGEGRTVFFVTYRTDEDYASASGPGVNSEYCARWHRMLSARLAEAVPGLVVSYWNDGEAPVLEDFKAKFSSV